MKNFASVVGVALVVGIFVGISSCGGSGGGGSCGAVQPCGGSVVGTWKASQVCILDPSLAGIDATAICATATVEITSVSATGTSTYGADLTYQTAGTEKFGFRLTIPGTCSLNGMTCADVDANFKQQMQQDPTITSASCATSGTACVCNEMVVLDSAETGTYATSGTALTTTPAGQAATTDQYCVQGTALHDILVDMTMPMGGIGTVKVAGDFVLTKQ
jgi:hypothetical protein